MFKFQASIFKSEHKSNYSKQDVDILDEFRAVANVGHMRQVNEKNDLIKLDITKAYTAAFAKIKNVPVFNEFDLFKPYKGEELSDYCLYIVKATKQTMFFNKRYKLCYGLFLKKFVSITLNGTVCNTSGASGFSSGEAAFLPEARELRKADRRALEDQDTRGQEGGQQREEDDSQPCWRRA